MPHCTKSLWLPIFLLVCGSQPTVAQDSTAVVSEHFDGIVFPGLPSGWRSSGTGWATSDAVHSSGSGRNNLMHTGIVAGQATLPPADLSRMKSATLTYLARRTSTYRQDKLIVRASTDGGVSFPIVILAGGAALPASDGDYTRISTAIPDELLGVSGVVIQFEALGAEGGMANIRIDDVLVYGEAGGIELAPDRLTFTAGMGTYQERVLTVENTLTRSVQLSAPLVAGSEFSVVPGDATLLAPGATRSYTVTFAPQVNDPHDGRVVFQHDFGESSVSLSGTVGTNQFGFSLEEATAIEGDASIAIPLRLQYENATPMEGLAFTVSWDTDALHLADVVRGSAITNSNGWLLSYEPEERRARVVIMGTGTAGIPAGMHAPLVTLRFSGAVPQGTNAVAATLTLQDVDGSLAVATGDDAAVTVSPETHRLTLRKRQVGFHVSTQSIDLGAVDAGQSVSSTLAVANKGGTDTLRVGVSAGSSTLFTVTPASASVAPDKEQVFTVTFAPTEERFGRQSGRLIFSHDAEGGSAEVQLSGLGQGGRGDGYKDGMVEAMDLAHLIDFILERDTPALAQQRALDLYPFPEGDGQLSVHDATVVSHAIVNGRWPDGVGLPAETAPDIGVSGKTKPDEGTVALRAVTSGDEMLLYVRHDVPLRALQLILEREDAVPVEALPVDGATLLLRPESDSGKVRLLLYSAGGDPVTPGEHALATFSPFAGSAGWKVLYATAVDSGRERLPVDISNFVHPDTTGRPIVPPRLELEAPYPNPFPATLGHRLRVHVDLPEPGRVRLTVFDVLGRHIAQLYDGERAAGRLSRRGMVVTAAARPCRPDSTCSVWTTDVVPGHVRSSWCSEHRKGGLGSRPLLIPSFQDSGA